MRGNRVSTKPDREVPAYLGTIRMNKVHHISNGKLYQFVSRLHLTLNLLPKLKETS